MPGPRRFAVLGGGITGLAIAYHLARRGQSVRLFEATHRCGGNIRSARHGHWLVEAGPNAIQETPEVAALIAELGLQAERLPASPAAKRRYLALGGRLVPLPLSPAALVASPLLPPWSKAKVFGEIRRRPGPMPDEQSFADFIREHFGGAVLRRMAQPFVSGVYAGDAERLSAPAAFPKLWDLAREHGSLLRAQIRAGRARAEAGLPAVPPLVSFRNGLQQLADALAAGLPPGAIATGRAVERLERAGDRWTVEGDDGGGFPWRESADAVVSGLPAHMLARLRLDPHGDRPFAFLGRVEHPPVASLFAGFPEGSVGRRLDGFGFLVPATERLPFLGVIFSSTLFPGRAPPGHTALTLLLGGSLQPEQAGGDAAALWAACREPLRRLLKIPGEPVLLEASYWPEAIPQYELEHRKLLAQVAGVESDFPGLTVAGNFRYGISVPDCLAAARRLAAELAP